MKIGGFIQALNLRNLELQLPANKLAMHSGRSSLIAACRAMKVRKLYVPNFYCPEVSDALVAEGIDVRYYAVNEMLCQGEPFSWLPQNAHLLYVVYFFNNHFGGKNKVAELSAKLKDRVIIDNVHDYFAPNYPESFSFNSARKWFAVPDGSFLRVPDNYLDKVEEFGRVLNTGLLTNHLVPHSNGINKHDWFKANEERISSDPVFAMSPYTAQVLSESPMTSISETRKANFMRLHSHLAGHNRLSQSNHLLNMIELETAPFCYPFLPKDEIARAKIKLAADGIYVPTFWPELYVDPDSFAADLVGNLLPLPLDQRYKKEDMDYLAEKVVKLC